MTVAEISVEEGIVTVRAEPGSSFDRFALALGGFHTGDAWLFPEADEVKVRECFRRAFGRPREKSSRTPSYLIEPELRRVAEIAREIDLSLASADLLRRVSDVFEQAAAALRTEARRRETAERPMAVEG